MPENDQESLLEMHLDYDGGNILQETVRWSRFLSIAGLVGAGLLLLITLLLGSSLLILGSRALPGLDGFAGIFVACLALLFGVLGVLAYLLYRFSTQTRRGIQLQDQALFNQGMKNLRIYFLLSGIFAIAGLLINLYSLTSLL